MKISGKYNKYNQINPTGKVYYKNNYKISIKD